MSLRYVWDKSTFEYYANQHSHGGASAIYPNKSEVKIYYGSSYSTDFSVSNCFTIYGSKYVTLEEDASVTIPAGSYYAVNYRNTDSLAYTPENLEITWEDGKAYFYFPYPYKVDKSPRPVDFIAKVSATSSSLYPNGGVSGDYYYKRLGSDTIDASTVVIPPLLIATETPNAAVIVTANSGNKYGGTVTYKYEYSINGGSTWIAYRTTTNTSLEIPIPNDAASFKVRVLASDDMGFVSSTYVLSATASVVWNVAPTTPAAITVPALILSEKFFEIACSVSADENDNLSGYSWEVQYDGGDWTEFWSGTEPAVTTSVPFGTVSVAYRVRAYDSLSAYSDYCISESKQVINNNSPTISGEDGDLGTFGLTIPNISFVVSDADGGEINTMIMLDGAVVQSGAIELDAENLYVINASDWLKVLNGTHEIVITAEDEYGATAVRTYTFTKDVTELSVTLSEPWITDGMVTRMYILPVWSVPEGATVQVLATNNALDAEPVWQDVTEAVKLGKKFYFENATKTAADWAVNFKVLADRGTADKVYIKKLTGAFDGLGGA